MPQRTTPAPPRKTRRGTSSARRACDCPRRAVFVHQGFCRPAIASIQSPSRERNAMTEAVENVPIIFTPRVERQTLRAGGRIAALVIGLAALTVLVLAVQLKPSNGG